MKINYLKEPALKEDHVDVHYRQESETIDVIRDFFLSFQCITGKREDGVYRIHPGSIYYLEVVDRKLFACQEEEVCQLDYSLKEFLGRFGKGGFVQIGKSLAVNIFKVSRVKTDLNMRLRLQLDNGEELVLNRSYKKTFLDALHQIQEACHEDHQ